MKCNMKKINTEHLIKLWHFFFLNTLCSSTTIQQASILCSAKAAQHQCGLHKVADSKYSMICSCTSNQRTVIVRVGCRHVVVFDWGGTWCTRFHLGQTFHFRWKKQEAVCLHVGVCSPLLSSKRFEKTHKQKYKQTKTSNWSYDWQKRHVETRCLTAFSRSLFKALCLLVSGHRLVVYVVSGYIGQRKQNTTKSSLTSSESLGLLFFWWGLETWGLYLTYFEF